MFVPIKKGVGKSIRAIFLKGFEGKKDFRVAFSSVAKKLF